MINDEVGQQYILGPCRYEEDTFVSCVDTPVSDIKKLADKLRMESHSNNNLTSVLVADEETCRKVVNELNKGLLPSKRNSMAFEVRGTQNAPSFPLAIAFKRIRGNEDAAADIRLGLNLLFEHDLAFMAGLYADVTNNGLKIELQSPQDAGFQNRSTWRPEFFQLSSEKKTLDFWLRFRQHLLDTLNLDLLRSLGYESTDVFLNEKIMPDLSTVPLDLQQKWSEVILKQEQSNQ